MIFLFSIFFLFSTPSYSQQVVTAGTTLVSKRGDYYLYKTPWYMMSSQEAGLIQDSFFRKMRAFFVKNAPALGIEADSGEEDQGLLDKINAMIEEAQKEFDDSKASSLHPSAFIIVPGIKFKDFKIKGAAVLPAFVFVPYQYIYIRKFPDQNGNYPSHQQMDYFGHWTIIGLSTADLGRVGENSKDVNIPHLGVGWIWGQLDNPEDLTGAIVSISGHLGLGVEGRVLPKLGFLSKYGFSARVGAILHGLKPNPFLLVSVTNDSKTDLGGALNGGLALGLDFISERIKDVLNASNQAVGDPLNTNGVVEPLEPVTPASLPRDANKIKHSNKTTPDSQIPAHKKR